MSLSVYQKESYISLLLNLLCLTLAELQIGSNCELHHYLQLCGLQSDFWPGWAGTEHRTNKTGIGKEVLYNPWAYC